MSWLKNSLVKMLWWILHASYQVARTCGGCVTRSRQNFIVQTVWFYMHEYPTENEREKISGKSLQLLFEYKERKIYR